LPQPQLRQVDLKWLNVQSTINSSKKKSEKWHLIILNLRININNEENVRLFALKKKRQIKT